MEMSQRLQVRRVYRALVGIMPLFVSWIFYNMFAFFVKLEKSIFQAKLPSIYLHKVLDILFLTYTYTQ